LFLALQQTTHETELTKLYRLPLVRTPAGYWGSVRFESRPERSLI